VLLPPGVDAPEGGPFNQESKLTLPVATRVRVCQGAVRYRQREWLAARRSDAGSEQRPGLGRANGNDLCPSPAHLGTQYPPQ
jgi:hypothetical protein